LLAHTFLSDRDSALGFGSTIPGNLNQSSYI